MQFTSRLLRHSGLILLSVLISGCAALDPYINPYYEDDPADSEVPSAAESAATSEESNAEWDRVVGRERRPDSQPRAAEQNQGSTVQGSAAQDASLLATAGPNPYYVDVRRVGSTVSAEFTRGISAIEAGDWPLAQTVFERLSKQQSKLSGPWLYLGVAQEAQGDLEQAKNSYEKALAVNQHNQEAYNRLGLLLRKQGDFNGAEQVYQRAIGVWPAYEPIRLNLGILYELYLGDLGKALQQYEIYQSLLAEPDRRVGGWIKDLQRRLEVSAS